MHAQRSGAASPIIAAITEPHWTPQGGALDAERFEKRECLERRSVVKIQRISPLTWVEFHSRNDRDEYTKTVFNSAIWRSNG